MGYCHGYGMGIVKTNEERNGDTCSNTEVRIAVLKCEEKLTSVAPEDIELRKKILYQLRKLPDEMILKLRYFQPQVGCPNVCSFCSQWAGKTVIRITDRGLRNIISALKTIAIEIIARDKGIDICQIINADGGLTANFRLPEKGLVACSVNRKKGIIYPYLDTDIGSYLWFYEYVRYMSEDLGVSVRISTVGYSRHNKNLQMMHEKIVKEFPDAIAGIRFSLTPYTYGWTSAGETSGKYSRMEFNRDMANTIKTYSPLIKKLGVGRDTFCIDLRFKPEVFSEGKPLDEGYVYGHHFIHSGPYLAFSSEKSIKLEIAKITEIHGRKPILNTAPQPYLLVISDELLKNSDWRTVASELITEYDWGEIKIRENMRVTISDLYKYENAAGIYYALDPTFKETGHFEALHFYTKTESRKVSGYNNAERVFLNAIIDYKKKEGIPRREQFHNATFSDVNEVVKILRINADETARYDKVHSTHIKENILPLVESYIEILRSSGLNAELFFNPDFTEDTGQIVNQGRASTQFLGLAGKEDIPITPNEDRSFGALSFSSLNGIVYRLSPNPTLEVYANRKEIDYGKKNCLSERHSVSFAPVGHNLTVDSSKRVVITAVEIEDIPIEQCYDLKQMPGINVE